MATLPAHFRGSWPLQSPVIYETAIVFRVLGPSCLLCHQVACSLDQVLGKLVFKSNLLQLLLHVKSNKLFASYSNKLLVKWLVTVTSYIFQQC